MDGSSPGGPLALLRHCESAEHGGCVHWNARVNIGQEVWRDANRHINAFPDQIATAVQSMVPTNTQNRFETLVCISNLLTLQLQNPSYWWKTTWVRSNELEKVLSNCLLPPYLLKMQHVFILTSSVGGNILLWAKVTLIDCDCAWTVNWQAGHTNIWKYQSSGHMCKRKRWQFSNTRFVKIQFSSCRGCNPCPEFWKWKY